MDLGVRRRTVQFEELRRHSFASESWRLQWRAPRGSAHPGAWIDMPWRALMRLAELYRDEESPNFRRGDTAAEYFESVQEDVEYFLSRGQLARAQETVEETLSDLEYATDDEFLDPNDPEVTSALEALEAFTIILDLSE